MIEHAPAQTRREVAAAWRQSYRLQLEERMHWWCAVSIVFLVTANGALIIVIIGYVLHLPFLSPSALQMGKSLLGFGYVVAGCALAAALLTALGSCLHKRRIMRLDAPPVSVTERNCSHCALGYK